MFGPTVNSYKRLVDGFWAPVKPTWGVDNRTASFRVHRRQPEGDAARDALPGRRRQPLPGDGRGRSPPACTASRRGSKLTAPPITGTNEGVGDIPRAPRTLIETTRNFQQSKIARDWFGDDFVDHFAATRDWEWRQWQDARDRLGAEALLRDHLSRVACRMAITTLLLPDHDPLRAGARKLVGAAPRTSAA